MKGYVHIYTGNGKGKSTAAFGLALRASGAGLKVFIGQFMKGQPYSELDAFTKLSELITVRQYGKGCCLRNGPAETDVRAAHDGLGEISRVIQAGEHQVVILDEANMAASCQLIPVKALLRLIEMKPVQVELVLTGRYAAKELIDAADLVTEMKEQKHYYQQGVPARKGIEC
jgi:cob(I)alamin adenosyltransferase